jgi:hypothetical protein
MASVAADATPAPAFSAPLTRLWFAGHRIALARAVLFCLAATLYTFCFAPFTQPWLMIPALVCWIAATRGMSAGGAALGGFVVSAG